MSTTLLLLTPGTRPASCTSPCRWRGCWFRRRPWRHLDWLVWLQLLLFFAFLLIRVLAVVLRIRFISRSIVISTPVWGVIRRAPHLWTSSSSCHDLDPWRTCLSCHPCSACPPLSRSSPSFLCHVAWRTPQTPWGWRPSSDLESSKRSMASTIVETSSSPQNLPATIVFHLYTMGVHQGLDEAGIQRLACHMDTSQLPWPLWPRRRAQNKLKRVLVHVEVALVPPLRRDCRRASPLLGGAASLLRVAARFPAAGRFGSAVAMGRWGFESITQLRYQCGEHRQRWAHTAKRKSSSRAILRGNCLIQAAGKTPSVEERAMYNTPSMSLPTMILHNIFPFTAQRYSTKLPILS